MHDVCVCLHLSTGLLTLTHTHGNSPAAAAAAAAANPTAQSSNDKRDFSRSLTQDDVHHTNINAKKKGGEKGEGEEGSELPLHCFWRREITTH